MTASFSGSRIIVTGGTSGIGAATVRAFADAGAQVAYCGLGSNEGPTGPGLRGWQADVRDRAAVQAFVHQATDWLGGLDIAVNSAGISHLARRLGDMEADVFRDVMATNVDGIFHAMQAEIAALRQGGHGGVIINIASILSQKAAPWMAAYGASKQAVASLTASAAADHAGDGIRINALSPGPVDTPMFARAMADIGNDLSKYAGGLPPGPPAQPDAIARTVLFLASDEAAYITGANIIIDGGTSAWHGPSSS